MFKNKNDLFRGLLFLAVLSFVFISIGGEFLHSNLHHHQDQTSRDQCFVYQVQAQAFIVSVAALVALLIKINQDVAATYQVFVSNPYRIIPFSHAPPVSL